MKRILCALVVLQAFVVPRSANAQATSSWLHTVESTLALVVCDDNFRPGYQHYETAVVIASSPSQSYLAAPVSIGCKPGATRMIYPGGVTAKGWPARSIPPSTTLCPGSGNRRGSLVNCWDSAGMHMLNGAVEIVAIGQGSLPVAKLADGAVSGDAYVLGYTESTQPASVPLPPRIEPRLNHSSLSSGQPIYDTRVIAARGVSLGGVVCTATGTVAGVVSAVMDPPAPLLDLPDQRAPLPATSDYQIQLPAALRDLMRFASESIPGANS